MKEKLKDARVSEIILALLAVILGVLCVVFPDKVTSVVGQAIGIVIVIVGAVMIISRIKDESFRLPAIILGAVLCAVGLFIFSNPNGVLSLIFVVFGVLMLADGVSGINLAFVMKGIGTPNWWISMLLSLITFVFGVICILNAMQLLNVGTILIGIMLVYDGITSFYSLIRVKRAEKGVVDSKILHEKDI